MEINTSISSVRLIGSKQITLSPSIISTKREPKSSNWSFGCVVG